MITETLARKVLEVVDAGLCRGKGEPTPGAMCVEAAVCYAMGLPHSDDPPCVSPAVRRLKITLNDSAWSSNAVRAKGMRRLAVAQLGTADALDDREFARRAALVAVTRVIPRALRIAATQIPEHATALEAAAWYCESATPETANAAARAAYAAAWAAWAAARASLAAAADAAAAASAADAAARAAAASAADAAAAVADAAARAASRAAVADAAASAASRAARDEQLSLFAEDIVQILVEMNAPGTKFLHLTTL